MSFHSWLQNLRSALAPGRDAITATGSLEPRRIGPASKSWKTARASFLAP